jgi:predicted double-glycine peptidase
MLKDKACPNCPIGESESYTRKVIPGYVALSLLIELLATVVFGFICWSIGMRLGRLMLRRGATANDLFKGNKLLVIVVLVLYVGLVSIAINLPQWQGLPVEWRLYGLQVSWTIIRVLLLGACGVGYVICRKTASNQVIYMFIVGLLGLVCFTAAEVFFVAPIYPQLSNNLKPNGIYRQTGDSSCAPAALATLLQRWQMTQATESEVARLAGTSRMGTSMPQVLNAARSLGFDGTELSPTWEQLRQINRPGILGVWQIVGLRKLPHAVALMAMNNDRAIIADPARGKYVQLDRQELARIWRGEYLPIYRPGDDRMTVSTATEYLKKRGYANVRSFQEEMGLNPTGKLDAQTVLMLNGKLTKPTLDETTFNREIMTKMQCLDNPQACPW